ncbi:MAG: glycosyltransferase [Candidatus Doudnabacteria bacterium]|nr:glycosyltransferase [bacterium]MDZ4243820.1 glycosyltransferase [Candidatus Doudnabacteria bacterium]
MRVLMTGLDKGLFGGGVSGDVVERHRKYADLAGHLDIIVFAGDNYQEKQWASNLRVFPTRTNKFSHFARAVEMASTLQEQEPYDLIVTQDFTAPVGMRLKRKYGLPWIVNTHSMFFSWNWLGFNPLSWYLFFLIKRAIKQADGFRVNNEEIRDKLIDWGIEKPILVQPTPIDVTKFKSLSHVIPAMPTGRQAEAGIQQSRLDPRVKPEDDKSVILFVGRLSPEKNVAMLIRAVKNLKEDFELWIVGKGPEEANLKRLAGNDERIRFLGPKTIDELPVIFQSADIFALPSNTESFGQVLLQAAAAGCAIIATATPGARSVLSNEKYGLLIPVGFQRHLEAALKNLISKTFEREYWATQAQILVAQYDPQKGFNNTIAFWKKIVKG